VCTTGKHRWPDGASLSTTRVVTADDVSGSSTGIAAAGDTMPTERARATTGTRIVVRMEWFTDCS